MHPGDRERRRRKAVPEFDESGLDIGIVNGVGMTDAVGEHPHPVDVVRVETKLIEAIFVGWRQLEGSVWRLGNRPGFMMKARVENCAVDAMPRSAISAVFGDVGCSPKIARTLVKSGADPRIASGNGRALTRLRRTTGICDEHLDKIMEMARTLIAFGVPLEQRDDLGWTTLMGCDSLKLAQLLLAHGADPKARAKDGTTPVLATDDDRVA